MHNLRRTMSRDVSMKSRSNSSIKVDDPNPKDNQSQQSDYHISEHKSEYISLSQLKLQEDEEDLKKLENSDNSLESISCNSDIHGEGMIAIMGLNMMKILTKLKN